MSECNHDFKIVNDIMRCNECEMEVTKDVYDYFNDKLAEASLWIRNYNPLADTVEGKAQCWDLAIKLGLGVYPANGSVFVPLKPIVVEDKNPQRAVILASILAAQGEG